VNILAAAGTFVLGVMVGLSSVALHHYWWGLTLAIATTGTTAYALPQGSARLPFALGWVGIVGYLAFARDQGGYVIAGDLQGYALLGFGVALLVAAMVTLPPLRRGSPMPDEAPT
jgi:hypothetical protein